MVQVGKLKVGHHNISHSPPYPERINFHCVSFYCEAQDAQRFLWYSMNGICGESFIKLLFVNQL